jgi:hypothetical protein
MVGVINPNSTQTLAGQILAAKNAKSERAPGEQAPTAETSATPTPHVGSHGALTTGMIIGIVIGIVALVGVCAALCFFIGRHKSMKEALKRSDAVAMTKPVGVGGDMGQGSQKYQYMSSCICPRSHRRPHSHSHRKHRWESIRRTLEARCLRMGVRTWGIRR